MLVKVEETAIACDKCGKIERIIDGYYENDDGGWLNIGDILDEHTLHYCCVRHFLEDNFPNTTVEVKCNGGTELIIKAISKNGMKFLFPEDHVISTEEYNKLKDHSIND
jgi:hypothetical protein